MIFACHRINTIKKLKKIPKFYAIEIDVRDYKNKIILHHDPFKKGDTLSKFLESYNHRFLILNIKSEGIEIKVLQMLKKFNIKKYFFLDCSFPSIIKLIKGKNRNIAIRISDYESFDNLKKMKYLVKWVWIDCFNTIPLNQKNYNLIKKYKFKICLVSPELHGRKINNKRVINLIKTQKIHIDMLCSKINFFQTWRKKLKLNYE